MKIMAKGWLAAGWLLAVGTGVAFGRIPEPDTIVMGTVANAPLGSSLEVRAVLDGATLASSAMNSSNGAFLLRIPMDDGTLPRLAGTAKANDRVRLLVVVTTTGASAEMLETRDGGMEIPSGRGQVLAGTFRVAEDALAGGDANMNGIPDAWENLSVAGKSSYTDLNAAEDNDGDNLSNWEEYIAGTDPLDENSVFDLRSIRVEGKTVIVTAGPGAAGRRYSLKHAAALGAGTVWTPVATVEVGSEGGEVPIPWSGATEGGFFRVEVEIAE